ncbi:MAG: hypothetical protein ACRC46_14915 [Thermoguttaceae bacterium]
MTTPSNRLIPSFPRRRESIPIRALAYASCSDCWPLTTGHYFGHSLTLRVLIAGR